MGFVFWERALRTHPLGVRVFRFYAFTLCNTRGRAEANREFSLGSVKTFKCLHKRSTISHSAEQPVYTTAKVLSQTSEQCEQCSRPPLVLPTAYTPSQRATASMASPGCKVFPRVKEVRAYVVEGAEGDQGADCHDVADAHWINGTDPSSGNTPIANPTSGYAQYAGARKSWGINALGGLVVEIEADDGTTGVGVTIGGEAGAQIVERHLSRFVEGRDPRIARSTSSSPT